MSAVLTYSAAVADTVFSGLPTPGLVPAGSGQAGMLVSSSGQALSLVTCSFKPRVPGQSFDGSLVRAGYLRDVDGTNSETLLIDGPPDSPGSIIPLYGPTMLPILTSTIKVPATAAASFRVYVRNGTPIDLVVEVFYMQGS